METKERLVRAAMALRAASSSDYEEFCRALDQLRIDHDTACIEASPDATQRHQGRAIGTRTLLADLMNAPTTLQKIQAAQKAKSR